LILAGALACGVAYFVMFQVPHFDSAWLTDAYVFTTLIFYATSYALFSVPYRAMAAELTDDYHGRSTLMSIGSVFTTIGSLVGTSSAPGLIAHYGGGRQGHEQMAVVMGLGTCAVGVLCFALTSGARSRPRAPVRGATSKAPLWSLFASNRPFVILLVSTVMRGIAVSFMNGTAVFYTRWVLKVDYAWLSRFFLLLTGSIILSLPFWVWFSRRIGKRNAFLVGSALFALGSLAWPFSTAVGDPLWLYLARTLSMGIGSGAVVVIGQSMLPDAMEYDRRTTGQHREGVFAGFYTTAEKASNAAGVAILGVVLGASGYIPSATTQIAQPHGALLGIYLCFAIAPALLFFASAAVMLLYPITEKYLHGLTLQNFDAPSPSPSPSPSLTPTVAGSVSVSGNLG
jgi:GPH family glycoside/pentoside/hexuronide:cation symporter